MVFVDHALSFFNILTGGRRRRGSTESRRQKMSGTRSGHANKTKEIADYVLESFGEHDLDIDILRVVLTP